MPQPYSRRTAVIVTVSFIVLSLAVIAAAAAAPGAVSFTSATYEIEEGDVNAPITLKRTGGADGTLTAKLTLTGGTATGGVDYRLPSPGGLDFAFNQTVSTSHYVRTTVEQPDGKILVGGFFGSVNNVIRNAVARLNADGTLDNSFNAGTAAVDVFTIALQPDGKILLGGLVSHNGGQRTGITRLNPDGSYDTTFTPGTGTGGSAISAVALQPDGKILICGNFISYNGTGVFALARLNADGTLDTSFNANVGQSGSRVDRLVVQPDGKILAAGPFSTFAGHSRNGVARINSDGSYDSTFNPGNAIDTYNVQAIALQPDGKVLVGGGFYTNMVPASNTATAVARLNPDGTVDPTFTAPTYGPLYSTAAIALQPDGKILLGGIFRQTLLADGNHWLDRRNADGSDDASFNPGLVSFSNSGVGSITVQHDGRILVAGQFSQSNFSSLYKYLVRLEGDTFVTWDAGDTADKTVPLRIFQDTGHEENETVNLKVEAVTPGATAEPIQNATLTILDNDPLVGFVSAAYSFNENAGTVSIPLERTGWTQGTTSVNINAPFGSAGAGAGSGDFTLLTPSPVVFAPGETTKTVTINLIDDAVNERDEAFFVEIAAVSGGQVARGRTDITILNDDPLPTLSIADTSIVEGDAGTKQALFTVTRNGLIDRTVTVNVRTVDGTAVAGEDYVSLGSQFITQLQIGPSAGSNTVSVSVFGDTIVEPNKTFSVEISQPVNATITRARADCEIQDNDTTTGVPTVQFNAREFRVQESAGLATLTVTRSGDASAPTNVGYSTALWIGVPPAGSAWDRNDYTFTSGTLRFAAGERSKTIQVFIADDALVEGDETLSVALSGPTGGTNLGTPSTANVRIIDNDTAPSSVNPLDNTSFFVRQHYRDFLGRDPDAPGLAFWTNEIEQCGADQQCREVKRVNVSAAFFLSIEFQETGYYVFLLYKAAFNTGERLAFANFAFDSQQVGRDVVVGTEGWEQKLAANKQAFADDFVARSGFLSAYPSGMSPAQFVDALNANTGDPLNPSAGGALAKAERDQLVADLTSGAKTRAQVLRAVAENAEFRRRQLSKAFVLMQYFGYLRRAPNALPDTTFDGYNFWLSKLNEFNGNYINAEMVKAFITSDEYRKRFGQQ
ncbi:MAG: hypothetical protein JOZ96_19800 [Acidobacteria bacterium]|nr:hypothetical protein [Acidobacteriota bacterium]